MRMPGFTAEEVFKTPLKLDSGPLVTEPSGRESRRAYGTYGYGYISDNGSWGCSGKK